MVIFLVLLFAFCVIGCNLLKVGSRECATDLSGFVGIESLIQPLIPSEREKGRWGENPVMAYTGWLAQQVVVGESFLRALAKQAIRVRAVREGKRLVRPRECRGAE